MAIQDMAYNTVNYSKKTSLFKEQNAGFSAQIQCKKASESWSPIPPTPKWYFRE